MLPSDEYHSWGYFNSRLNNNLREGHGWTYGSGSSLNPDKLVGSFNASASVRNAVTDSSIIEALKEMRRLRDEKVDQAELQVVKTLWQAIFQKPGRAGHGSHLALNTARYKPQPITMKSTEVLQNVSAEQVQAYNKSISAPTQGAYFGSGQQERCGRSVEKFSADGKSIFMMLMATR
ncbi:MAG: insulinase family protein [Lewinellaceae bacterium]|nr:insulinase family protein [Lewinellaceae bacterium]